jgi:hypothetical protein
VAQVTAGLMGGAAFLGSQVANLTSSDLTLIRWIDQATAWGVFEPGSARVAPYAR